MLIGRSIAVVGATGGIGKSILSAVHEKGAFSIAMARRPERLAELVEVSSARLLIDLESPDGWSSAIEMLPPLDGIVISSGKLEICPSRVLKPESFLTAININVVSPVSLLRSIARAGKLCSSCSIVFIGSVAGIRGTVGHLAYSACKAALQGVVRTLALELAPQRIRVNLVSPGLVLGGMGENIRNIISKDQLSEYSKKYPLGLGNPSDIAGPVTFLLSSEARWITGQDIIVDGGVTIS